MGERIKWASLNFFINTMLWFAYQSTLSVFFPIVMCINLLIGVADLFFLDGQKYGKKAYIYLKLNRAFNLVLVWTMGFTCTNKMFLFLIVFYIWEFVRVIKNQYEIISDDIELSEIEEDYLSTLYELNTILNAKQKEVFENLKSIVDEDKMYAFLITFHPNEIKILMNAELWGLAFLIQKEDVDSLLEIVEKSQ